MTCPLDMQPGDPVDSDFTWVLRELECVCAEYADSDECGCRPCRDRALNPAACPHRLDAAVAGAAGLHDGMCDWCFQEARGIRGCGLRLAEHATTREEAA